MKIAILHWGFPPTIGGVETHLSLLGPELVKRGHKAHLLTGSIGNHKVEHKYKGVAIKRSPLFDLNWLFNRGFEDLENEIKNLINMFLDRSKPDVIHAHNMHYFSEIHAKTLDNYARKNRIPLILTAHNVWNDGDFLDLTLDIEWKHIIAVSEYIKFELMGIRVPEHKITVVHHGIDINKFKNTNSERILAKYPTLKKRKIIFHPARIGLAKGCDVSLKALRIIKRKIPEALLILTGTKNTIDWGTTQQKDIAYMLHLTKKLNLKNNVFIQMIPLGVMPSFYHIADVCVYPSSSQEPFGITMLESLASGVPIVVTKSGGMVEVIKDGVNGFVVKIKDYKELAERCISILKDKKLRQELGENGRMLIKERYTKEIMAENTIKVYEKALTGKKGETVPCTQTQKKYYRRQMSRQGAVQIGTTGGGS